jgi:transcriptional regulator with XRE-family HTH domain
VVLTGAQIRAARALLNISVAQLAAQTGLAINTIRRAEGTNEVASITPVNMALIRSTLEKDGVEFIEADQHGAGVRFKNPDPAPAQRRRRIG